MSNQNFGNVTSYVCKFKHTNTKALKDTITYYTQLCEYLKMPVLNAWDDIKDLSPNSAMGVIEHLIHTTTQNPCPKYMNFDKHFYKCPTYLRRAAINHVIGAVRSYKSNLRNWMLTDKSTKMPSIPKFKREFPVLYKGNMYLRDGLYDAKIKVFYKNDWVWIPIQFRKSDIDYIEHHCKERKELSVTLQYSHKKWCMTFAFQEKCNKLNTTSLHNRRILAVDLGINNAATCCVMDCNGTIQARSFLHLNRDKDHLHFILNRIKRAQRHGSRKMPALWAKAKGVNDAIATKTAMFIVEQAQKHNVDVIVFEHLDLQGKKRGSKKQMLHYWKAQTVQRIVTSKAHRLGIRISHVNARNTSRLAFDGSGKVTRGTYIQNGKECYNYSVCVFTNGKTYNCDLNASYNIGARYFIRELLKPLPETVKSGILAKVSECSARSTCTLSSLINLNTALRA